MRKTAAILILLALSIPAAAATLTVNWDGTGDYTTIQAAIDDANDFDTVLVWPGVYIEDVEFLGKGITVKSGADAAVIVAAGSYAVSFYRDENPDCILENFVIRDSYTGIQVVNVGTNPTINYVTVVNNEYGIRANNGGDPNINNSIFWNNADSDLSNCSANYSWVQDELAPGLNPQFADAAGGDYHLRSQNGRFVPVDPNSFGGLESLWAMDNVTSPCVDAGDPTIDPNDERMPNGGQVNIGAYGGTAYASMSDWPLKGDINHDGAVNLVDFAMIAEEWLAYLSWAY